MTRKTSFIFKCRKLPALAAALLLFSLLLDGCANVTRTPVLSTQVPPTPTQTPISPQPGGIRITKYPDNYTAFKIEVQDGATIITDPYMMDEKVHADIVTESHAHVDHTDTSKILKPFKLIDQPGSFEFAGVKITGIVGAHNKGFNVRPEINIGQENKNTIYVFDLGSIRIAQFASQGQFPSPDMFAQIGIVDVLIIQIYNTEQKLSISEAQEIATKLSARIIIPAHGNPELNQEFAKQIGTEFKQEPSGILNLTRSDLDNIKTPIVMVLDRP